MDLVVDVDKAMTYLGFATNGSQGPSLAFLLEIGHTLSSVQRCSVRHIGRLG